MVMLSLILLFVLVISTGLITFIGKWGIPLSSILSGAMLAWAKQFLTGLQSPTGKIPEINLSIFGHEFLIMGCIAFALYSLIYFTKNKLLKKT